MVTLTQLRSIFPKFDPIYVDALNETFVKYALTTKIRQASFIAQTGHESARFMRFEENLNYSAEGLLTIFPKYFPNLEAAQSYARNPQKIASYVYANRMGNGPAATGDGWTYRGRGAIQLTGKDTYMRFAKDTRMELAAAVNYLKTPRGAIMSGGWFWVTNHLNMYADKGDFVTLTKRINGGTHGYDDRVFLFKAAMKVL